MKRLLAIPLVVLGIASTTRAQYDASDALGTNNVVAVDLARTSAAGSRVPKSGDWLVASLTPPELSPAALSFSSPGGSPAYSSRAAFAEPVPAAPSPSPYNYLERDYRWEIGLAFSVVRFRSSVYYATAPGFHSSVAYFLNNWLAVEGAVTTGFAPAVYGGTFKYLGYGGGPKFSLGRRRFEPWVHALVGGVHTNPQTALGGKNGFELQAGAGLDYGLNPRLSARLEFDYLASHLFGQWQNSGQGLLGIVIHF
jgi:opacity protein-like surface antigen